MKGQKFMQDMGKLPTDLVCFSHLRWDFVFQRPQHLMARFTNYFRIFFIEEPMFHDGEDCFKVNLTAEKVWVITPHLANDASRPESSLTRQKDLLSSILIQFNIRQ